MLTPPAVPDPVALGLAETTPFPYPECYAALRTLASAGVPHRDAVELVMDAATAGVTPTSLARAYLDGTDDAIDLLAGDLSASDLRPVGDLRQRAGAVAFAEVACLIVLPLVWAYRAWRRVRGRS